MGSVLGIDVSKANLDVVLINGKRLKHKVFTNDPRGHQGMARWLVAERVGPLRVCLEATGQYGEAIAEYLYQRGYAVSVVNPARIKRYGERQSCRPGIVPQ